MSTQIHCILSFLLKCFKDTRRGVFLLDKTEIKNFAHVDRYIRGLPICNGNKNEDINTFIFPKKGKLHFKNRVKAHDAEVK